MIAKKHTLFITLAVCALALPTLGIAQQAVERPVQVDGHFALTVSWRTGTISAGRDWGEATHLGRYENLLDPGGRLDFQPFTITATGTVTAANGDKLFWTTPGTSFEVEFTGGTGRFENAKGGFETVSHSQPALTVIDADTVIVSFTYKGVGTITY